MRKIFFQWWEGPSGRRFTTLHPSQNHATRFRREISERKRADRKKKTWNSTLASKIGSCEVTDQIHDHIMIRLRGRSGLRAFVSDFKQ